MAEVLRWVADIFLLMFAWGMVKELWNTPLKLAHWRDRDEREYWTLVTTRLAIGVLVMAAIFGGLRWLTGFPRWMMLLGL